ncbi:MAG TPA: glutathione S-transferase family protein [Phenylobacterium sp.]|jgi:glutathione S-transferase
MALTLYYHPLSSYCWKALIALYEADVAFEPRMVNLGDPADRAAFAAVWPLAKFPVLRDDERGRTVPESTIVIEYLAQNYPQAASLMPADPDLAWQTRLRDRLFDNYIHDSLQRVVADRLRPEGERDPLAVDRFRAQIRGGYDLVQPMGTAQWAMGESFTLADCAAMPALFYADHAVPLKEWPGLAAYLGRLKARPSVARVLAEAEPFFQYFPLKDG